MARSGTFTPPASGGGHGGGTVATPRIAFTQINLQRSKDATAHFVRRFARLHTGIAIIQEPWVSHETIRGLNGAGKVWGVTRGRQRSCIVTRGLEARLVPKHTTEDLTTIVVEGKDKDGNRWELAVASAYFPREREVPIREFREMVADAGIRGSGLIAGCDANSHHTLWGSSRDSERGADLLEFLVGEDLDFLNRGCTPTFFTQGRGESVIDMTICTSEVYSMMHGWRVSEELSLSDHRYIDFWTEGRGEGPTYYRNARKTDWKRYRSDLREHLADFPGRYGTPLEIDRAVDKIEWAITRAFEDNCPLSVKRGKQGNVWWTKELDDLKKRVKRLYRKQRLNPRLREEYLRKLSEYKKKIRKTYKQGWRDFCGEVEEVNAAARLTKILARGGSASTGWVKGPDGEYSDTERGNLKILLEEHFPGFTTDCSPDVLASSMTGTGRPDWRTAQEVVGPGRVSWAIDGFAPFKAPGPDGISPAMLQQGKEILIGPLTKVFRACIALGYTPINWRTSRVVFLPKPGRVSHENAKDLRPVSLTSFLLKTLERLVDRKINEILKDNPLSDKQHAYQKGKSTETALHNVVGYIERNMRGRGFVLATVIDVVGAFNRTPYGAMEAGARGHGVPETIIKWIKGMLARRIVTCGQGSTTVTGQVKEGSPQGGVLSPKMWCFVVEELLIELYDNGFEAVGYSDDIAILTEGHSVQDVVRRMQRALGIVERWCDKVKLSVNPDKTQCVLFTKRRNLDIPEGPVFYGRTLVITDQVKYLGVILDRKLMWKQHIQYASRKFLNAYWLCKRMMGPTWGMKPFLVKWLYETVLAPRLVYGAVVWWSRASLLTEMKHLERLQAMMLRAMVGTGKTTPKAAMSVLADVVPLQIKVKDTALRSAARLKAAGLWRGGHGNHTAIAGESCIRVVDQGTDRIVESLLFDKNYRVAGTTREEWKSGMHPLTTNSRVWYTDGSKMNGNTGSAAWEPGRRKALVGSAGPRATVFQSEILAIKLCAEWLLRGQTRGERICICSDSSAALSALDSFRVDSDLVLGCKLALNSLGQDNRVCLLWVPAHVGIRGNEKADHLAKRGSRIREPTVNVGTPWCEILAGIRKWREEERSKWWTDREDCRQTKRAVGLAPAYKWSKELLRLPRKDVRLVVGWITGNCRFGQHRFGVGGREARRCRFCQEETETTEHILWECQAVEGRRRVLLGCETEDMEGKVPLSPMDILRFVKGLGLSEDEEGGNVRGAA